MNKLKIFDLTLTELWQIFIMMAIPVICVAGASFFPYMIRLPLIYTTGIITAFVFVFSNVKIRINSVVFFAMALLAYMGISIIYSYDSEATTQYFLLYLAAFALMVMDLPDDVYKKILSIFYVVCAVIAFSILISTVIDEFMLRFFGFIVNPGGNAEVTRSIRGELRIGAYSGFAAEKGEAAYVMNAGLAITLAKYFSRDKFTKTDGLMTVVFILALMLTGKRMLFTVLIAAFAVFMLVSKMKGKVFKGICIVLLALVGGLFIIMFVPSVANIINRFMDSDNLESFGGRDALWDQMGMMMRDYPIFGAGIGSFNTYAYDHGLRYFDGLWLYNGHNCYLQIAGEMGLVGGAIFALFVICAFVYSVKAIKRFEGQSSLLYLVYFSLYIQIMLIVYSLTGNPVYSRQILSIWFFSIGIVLHLYRSYVPLADSTKSFAARKGEINA